MTRKHSSSIIRNIISNVAFLSISVATRVWLTRYLIQHMGVSLYGVVAFVQALLDYVFFVQRPLSNIITRFVSIHYNKGHLEEANEFFSTSFFGLFLYSLLSSCAAFILIYIWISSQNEIPAHLGRILLFAAIIALAYFTKAIAIPFISISYIAHRFDIYNAVRTCALCTKITFIVLLFGIGRAYLQHYATAAFFQAFVTATGLVLFSLFILPELRIRATHFRLRKLFTLITMSSWASLYSIGGLLFTSASILVINMISGVLYSGLFAPFVQSINILSALIGALGNVFWPIAYEKVAQLKKEDLINTITTSIRFIGIVIALPVGLICGLSRQIVTIWLGERYSSEWGVFAILVGMQIFTCIGNPLIPVFLGTKKIRLPALSQLFFGTASILVSILLLLYSPLGNLGVAISIAAFLIPRNFVFLVIYASRILNTNPLIFYRSSFGAICSAFLVTITAYLIGTVIAVSDFYRLVIVFCSIGACYYTFIYFVVLSSHEKKAIALRCNKKKK